MMKKLLLGLIAISMSVTIAQAAAHGEHRSDYYAIVKGLMVTGGEGKDGIEGDAGYGIGFDVGYHLPHNFAVELVSSYAQNEVEAAGITEDATYLTYGIALEYEHHLSKKIAGFVKGGFEIENAEIGEESESENGFIYAVGIEYIINHKYDIVLEVEESTIESPMGTSVFAGVKYNF